MESISEVSKRLARACALSLEYPSERRRPSLRFEAAAPAAVMILFGWSRAGIPAILFTQRTDTVEHHKSQISFPGGRADPTPSGLEGARDNALRETHEEVGIPPTQIEIIGELPPLLTVTGFRVTPILGVLKVSHDETALKIQLEETSEGFWISQDELTRPGVYRDEKIQVGEVQYPIQVFLARDLAGVERRVWGVTASILKNLLDRLTRLG